MWQVMMEGLRMFLRVFGANFRGGQRRRKVELLQKIEVLDEKADRDELGRDWWAERYGWEKELTAVYK
jgi:hypothetical protein